jgi:hypothetical protein
MYLKKSETMGVFKFVVGHCYIINDINFVMDVLIIIK